MVIFAIVGLSGKAIEILQYEVRNLKEENSIIKAQLNKFKEETELDEPFFLFEMMTINGFVLYWANHMGITFQVICVCKATLKDALCSLNFSATTSHTNETASQSLQPRSWIPIQSAQFNY